MRELDYEKDLEIDPENLDVEWVEQPSLYMMYAKAFSDACKTRDFAKERRDIYKAKFADSLRKTQDKISEARIESEVSKDKEYLDLQKKRLNAEYEVSLLQGALYALDHKKRALEKLVDLSNREYFSSPKLGRNLGDEVAKRKMERNRNAAGSNSAVKERMKKNAE